MAIKFGMTVAQIIGQLTRGFIKAMGRKPDGLEKIKIQQEAVQRFKDMNKVVDMGGRPIDTSKGIMGGFEVGQKGIFDNIFARMQSQMGKNIKEVKTKNRPDVYDLDDYDITNMSDIKKEIIRTETKLGNLNPDSPGFREKAKELSDKIIALKNKMRDDKAMGGRIGLKKGKGIMQMASDPDPMSEADDISRDMFGKPYQELNEDELEQFREEMERLRNKFVSAPDPMDERNTMMENIAIQEFGKPLKDLSEDEIIQIEEMMEEMTKIDRGAPSITLAEGGRIGYKDGPKDPRRRTFMKIAGGLASLLPFGIGKIGKVAAPVITKAAEISGPALAKIVDTVMSFGKLVSLKGKRVKEMVTKKKHQGVEVTEDIQDGSYIIKKGDKEIYYKPGRQDETGGFEDDIIEVIEKRIKKAGGGIGYMLGE